MYVPGLRLSDRVLEPLWKVGVAPSTVPEADATVTLCPSGAMFVKLIMTLPALALSAVVLYFSWPPGLAAMLNVCPPRVPLAAGTGVEEVAELDVVGVAGAVVGVEAEEPVLDDELPQPAKARTPTASVSAESLGRERVFG